MIPIKKLLTTFCLILGITLPGLAQTTVSGTVTDAESNNALPGVNVTVKGMPTRGTSTDQNGKYSLTVPSAQDTLIFSFVGYIKREIPVNDRTTINISLSPNVKQLKDIVVIGYGTERKEDKTGSITSVNASDFNEGSITSPQELFQGKAAGVNVTSNDGAPGSGATIRIRGGSSLAASNDPLYVVDGVPLSGGNVSGMRNPLNTINPNDIESVSILKDASATAIYGSRASNGVIIITTKKGRQGQSLSVNYTGKLSYQTLPKKLDVFSPDQFRKIINDRFGNTSAPSYLGNANTNWQDQIYRNSFSTDHNLSFTGSTGDLPYRVSLGFNGNGGILKTSKMDRLTGSVNLNPTFLNDQLKVNVNLKGMQVRNRFANQGAIGSALAFDPTQPVTWDRSLYGGYYTWGKQTSSGFTRNINAPANPVALLNQTHDKSTVYRSIGNVKFDYNLPFVSNLSAKLNLGYDYSDVGNGSYKVPANAAFEDNNSGAPGVRRDYKQTKKNQLLDFYLNYNKDLSSIESSIDFTGGYSWEHHYSDGSTYQTNYNRSDTLVVDQNTSYKTEHYIVSFFGRLNYTFKDKYLLTATLRDDGTSRFSKDNRWGLFPSMALAWKINEEPFLQNVDAISELKLRLGYGITGQQRINQGDYPYLGTYTYSEPTAEYQFGSDFVKTLRPEGYNSNLKWEETTTYNVGVDYGFFNDRINGSIEAYYRQTNDLLNVVPVAAGTNFTNRILSNVGTLEVKGVEFNITGRPISTKDSFLEISFNATRNLNKITKLTNVDDPNYIGVETGGISGGVGNTIQINSVGYPRNSFYVYGQAYDKNGNPIEGLYVDRNGDGIINSKDKYRYKSPNPDVSLGLSARAKYKNWDASFSARAEIGNYAYNNVESNQAYSFMWNTQGYLTNSVTELKDTNFNNAQYHSDHFVQNASFLRMDNVNVGYTFNGLSNQIKSLRLSATVQNVFVITKYKGLDPEVFGGIDGNIYPRPRTFVLGLSLNL